MPCGAAGSSDSSIAPNSRNALSSLAQMRKQKRMPAQYSPQPESQILVLSNTNWHSGRHSFVGFCCLVGPSPRKGGTSRLPQVVLVRSKQLQAVMLTFVPVPIPEGPSTHYLRFLVPKTIPSTFSATRDHDFCARDLKY